MADTDIMFFGEFYRFIEELQVSNRACGLFG